VTVPLTVASDPTAAEAVERTSAKAIACIFSKCVYRQNSMSSLDQLPKDEAQCWKDISDVITHLSQLIRHREKRNGS
jgi:hypothetical protein